MPILDVDSLREYLKEPTAKEASLQRALEAAEAAVASYIGTEGLIARTVTETWHPRISTRILATENGPVTALSSVLVNGDDVSADTGFTYWTLRLQDEVGDGDEVKATFTTGWRPEDLPEPVRQAILMTAASVYARPDGGMARIVTPNLTEIYRADYLNVTVRRMLDPYKGPGALV